ncbi:MFS transporter [Allosalinactinospora lopnorensis]|uniref:MFS transporter n=1 Tax=Allosalinactinospora lopnorensis TaxID=1352348 RepID=UPI000623D84A|nr:MFS transporter [Allosalinactinospora lopnorensis]
MPAEQEAVTGRRRRRAASAAAAAAAVEWYEYFSFAIAAALIFGTLFFPGFSPVAGVLASFATFFVGFIARPLGGILAGHLGDKYGRKPMLVSALMVMGVATTVIGLLPPYAVIGLWAPVALVVLRVLQGVAVGAMWGGAMLLATEYAPEGKRGLYGSLVTMGVPIGLVAANAAFLAASAAAPGEAFAQWGWRLPFLIGLVALVLAWYIHSSVDETPEFRQAEAAMAAEDQQRRFPLGRLLREHFGSVVLATGSFLITTAAFYILMTGVLDYTTRSLGMERTTVLTIVLVVSALQLLTLPTFAGMSDRFGRLPVYAGGAVGQMVWAIPMFLLIDRATTVSVLIAVFVGTVFAAMMSGPQAALFAELFEPEVRYSGASLGYQLSATLGGGLAPFIMVLLLESTGTSMSISAYLIVLAVLALVCITILKKRVRAREAALPGPGAASVRSPS